MLIIPQITDEPLQQFTLNLLDGTSFDLLLNFKPLQTGWFINSLSYLDFLLQGVRVTTQPNMLHQWRNILPFGLACSTTGGFEPMFQESFSSGASNLYILSEQEVSDYTRYVNGG